MQKYIYLFLFLGFFAHLEAQIVNIPDAVFKAKLIALGVDTNADGDIQQSEALVVTSLDLSSPTGGSADIYSLVGIDAFTNLDTLNVSSNHLSVLEVSALTNLRYLDASCNKLTSLDVSACTNLKYLKSSENSCICPDFTNLIVNTGIEHLECRGNNLPNLDLTGCINLQYLNCNPNKLQSLDLSSCLNLHFLNCSGNYLTYLDVTPLVNLDTFFCAYNKLTNLDVSPLINLKTLQCYDNKLTNLIVTPLTNLQELDCRDNQLTSLDVTTLTNLQVLSCFNNQLTNLDVTPLTNLRGLICYHNQLTTLDVTTLTNLQVLYCHNNQLTNLGVNNCINLTHLSCANNLLASLDMSNCLNMTQLYCSSNQLTSLNVSTLSNLTSLDCNNNQLTSLNVSNLSNITSLNCNNNLLTSLEVTPLTNLSTLYCSTNQLTSLDVNNCTNLSTLACSNNPLTSLLMKNGRQENFTIFPNSTLQYICVDANQLSQIQQYVIQQGMPNIAVSTFCSQTPAINYNTISGTSTYDANLNGCSVLDSAYSNLKIKITNGATTAYIYTNNVGNYNVYVDTGTYTLTPQFQNPTYFNSSPATTSPHFPNNNFNLQTKDFCIKPNGIHHDVEIMLMPLTIANPGFDATYKLVFHNKGTTTDTGTISLDFKGNKLNFVSASITPSTQTTDQLTWAYSNFMPFETRSIDFTMNVLPPPTNNIGDTLNFIASMPLTGDVTYYDNIFISSQQTMGAFDPNDMTCLEGAFVNYDQIGDYLHYLVRFQNTGNYPAQNVIIVDTIDGSKLIATSIQIIETSHPALSKVENGILEVYFDNIQLADSFSNEPASHGYILFKIKTKTNLATNSTVSNDAEIYFDYNLPVVTNNAVTTFGGFKSVTATKTDLTYFGAEDGAINIEVVGGLSPYTYSVQGIEGNFQSSPNFYGLAAGTYNVIAKDAQGFIGFVKLTLKQPNEIVKTDSANVKVFPNPAKEELNISATFETATKGKIVLCDLLGRNLIEQPFEELSKIETSLPLHTFSKGVYLLRIIMENGIYTTEVVKE